MLSSVSFVVKRKTYERPDVIVFGLLYAAFVAAIVTFVHLDT
jgi:hypothetical protein